MNFEKPGADSSNPEEEYAKRELLEAALAFLTEQEVEILRLNVIEGRTLEETGRILNPEEPYRKERIRQWKMRALRKLEKGFNMPTEVHEYFKKLGEE